MIQQMTPQQTASLGLPPGTPVYYDDTTGEVYNDPQGIVVNQSIPRLNVQQVKDFFAGKTGITVPSEDDSGVFGPPPPSDKQSSSNPLWPDQGWAFGITPEKIEAGRFDIQGRQGTFDRMLLADPSYNVLGARGRNIAGQRFDPISTRFWMGQLDPEQFGGVGVRTEQGGAPTFRDMSQQLVAQPKWKTKDWNNALSTMVKGKALPPALQGYSTMTPLEQQKLAIQFTEQMDSDASSHFDSMTMNEVMTMFFGAVGVYELPPMIREWMPNAWNKELAKLERSHPGITESPRNLAIHLAMSGWDLNGLGTPPAVNYYSPENWSQLVNQVTPSPEAKGESDEVLNNSKSITASNNNTTLETETIVKPKDQSKGDDELAAASATVVKQAAISNPETPDNQQIWNIPINEWNKLTLQQQQEHIKAQELKAQQQQAERNRQYAEAQQLALEASQGTFPPAAAETIPPVQAAETIPPAQAAAVPAAAVNQGQQTSTSPFNQAGQYYGGLGSEFDNIPTGVTNVTTSAQPINESNLFGGFQQGRQGGLPQIGGGNGTPNPWTDPRYDPYALPFDTQVGGNAFRGYF